MDKKLRARTYQMKCLQHAPSKLCHERVGEFGPFIDKLNIYLLQFILRQVNIDCSILFKI